MTTDKTSATLVIPKSARNPLFDETSERAIRKAHQRKWTTLGSFGLILAIGVAAFLLQQNRKSSERTLTNEYLMADALFTSEQEKHQEALKAEGDKADFTKTADHSASGEKFAAFAKAYPNSGLGTQAALRAANIFIEAKKTDEAIDLIQIAINKTLKNNIAQAKLRKTLAGLYAEKKDYAKALAELDFAIKLPDNPVLNETKLQKAQVLYLNGKKEETATLLKELAALGGGFSLPGVTDNEEGVANEAALWLGYWGL